MSAAFWAQYHGRPGLAVYSLVSSQIGTTDWLVGERIDEFDGRHYELLYDSARYLAGE